MNAFIAIREREKIKAIVFILLTTLLATVAGLITHFDALAHAAGLSVSDKSVSGIIPLWVMTALRSVAVIGFLLASRLKNVTFNELRRELAQQTQRESAVVQEPPGEPPIPPIDYDAFARALVTAMQEVGTVPHVSEAGEAHFSLSLFAEKVSRIIILALIMRRCGL